MRVKPLKKVDGWQPVKKNPGVLWERWAGAGRALGWELLLSHCCQQGVWFADSWWMTASICPDVPKCILAHDPSYHSIIFLLQLCFLFLAARSFRLFLPFNSHLSCILNLRKSRRISLHSQGQREAIEGERCLHYQWFSKQDCVLMSTFRRRGMGVLFYILFYLLNPWLLFGCLFVCLIFPGKHWARFPAFFT